MLNSTRPPYTATEYSPAPKAEVGGRNIDPETDKKIKSKKKKYNLKRLQLRCLGLTNSHKRDV